MANIFQDKIVKYLTIGLFLVAIGLLVQRLLSKPTVLPQTSLPQTSLLLGQLPQLSDAILSIKNLGNLKVENLKPFIAVETPKLVGRDNPFEPYPLNEEIATTTATSSPSIITTSTNATSIP
ncbi:MAG: hypothetical protein NTZ42_04495 [Candidatus Gribaldobacteria bacterium]|nr:hypothetical protein [Candidatus Gribaldobacteria bacterium]